MSTPAFALTPVRVPRRLRRRQRALNRLPVQWHGAPLAEAVPLTGRTPSGTKPWLTGLVVLSVLTAHAVGAWYGNRVSLGADVKPKKTTLALEIVRPPKPLPKIEPPPPPPPKAPPKSPPPIQTAAILPSETPIAAPVETVAAVAAAEPAPPAPEPEPVKPAFGGIG